MAGNLVGRKRSAQCRTKVKTGCATCRIRKVKCDETKPSCRKCVDTGRTCDGYDSPFRVKVFTNQPINNARASSVVVQSGAGFQLQSILASSTSTPITPQDIYLLSRYLSTKTIFGVKLGCDEEARQILQASLNDLPIRHAVSSLRALREHFEKTTDFTSSVSVALQPRSRGSDFGLQQYCMALGGLAANLSSRGSHGLKSALLCCQIFISIEQVRVNYAAMTQHIIQGLSIMREYRSRPNYAADQPPLLDVFIIKMFAAPCKFAEPPAPADARGTTMVAGYLTPPQESPVEPRSLRTIAPDKRTELGRIAASTLEFLGKMSQVELPGNALRRLLSEKAFLLDSLESWLVDLELAPTDGPGPISVSFLRLFHRTLKIILMGALNSSPDLSAELRIENDRLLGIASNIDERVQMAYRTGSGTTRT